MMATYADKVKSATTIKDVNKVIQTIQEKDAWNPRHLEVKHRTQVLRKVPIHTTSMDILQQLDSQFETRVFDTVDTVVKDQHDSRRFYITYKTKEARSTIAGKGFKIGQTAIPPERGQISAYIPYVPYYMTKQDVDDLLKPYGTVTEGKFRRDNVNGTIRTEGYDCYIDLHDGKDLPTTLTIYDETFTIHNKDERIQCRYCLKYGHLSSYCRKRINDKKSTSGRPAGREEAI